MALIQVLVIEDDPAICMGICDALEFASYSARGVSSGEAGLEQLQNFCFDLVLLDIVLPGQNGMQLVQSIREKFPSLPVIMLTARGDVQDRIQGLRSGADDYIVKPFNVDELLARIAAVLRRAPVQADITNLYHIPSGVRVDIYRRSVERLDGSTVQLSEKEFELFKYLSARAGQIVGRDELIERIWGINPKGLHTRTVDMHIARLREKLDDVGQTNPCIVTVRGRGYCFSQERSDE
jgi:DNA-binding response OmpR family regulator